MNLVRQAVKTILSYCLGRERLLVRGSRSTGAQPRLALTFDDGPHSEHTPRLLDRMQTLGLRGTFFVLGRQAELHPALIQRMLTEGHEIANHTYSHAEPRLTSASLFLQEIEQTDVLLANLTGQQTSTVRPPKGELNWSKMRGIWKRHQTVALWNVDPKDFRMTRLDQMTTWCTNYQPQDGDIILLHDVHPYALAAIDALAAQGVFHQFETMTIAQWIRSDGNHTV